MAEYIIVALVVLAVAVFLYLNFSKQTIPKSEEQEVMELKQKAQTAKIQQPRGTPERAEKKRFGRNDWDNLELRVKDLPIRVRVESRGK